MLAVTPQQVVLLAGGVRLQAESVPLRSVSRLGVRQGPLQRLLGYGTLLARRRARAAASIRPASRRGLAPDRERTGGAVITDLARRAKPRSRAACRPRASSRSAFRGGTRRRAPGGARRARPPPDRGLPRAGRRRRGCRRREPSRAAQGSRPISPRCRSSRSPCDSTPRSHPMRPGASGRPRRSCAYRSARTSPIRPNVPSASRHSRGSPVTSRPAARAARRDPARTRRVDGRPHRARPRSCAARPPDARPDLLVLPLAAAPGPRRRGSASSPESARTTSKRS